MKKILLSTLIISALFSSCKKDDPTPPANTPAPANGDAYIINEGQFLQSNSSISFYDVATGAVTNDLFQQSNNRPLGDICQSITEINGKLYVVVNNSNKIEVCNKSILQSEGTISSSLSAPRYILNVNSSKAYVSELFSGQIKILDLNTNNVTDSIAVPGWTEEMVLLNGKAYTTNYDHPYVYVIDTATNSVTDSISVPMNGNSIVKDENNLLWVACQNTGGGANGSLVHVNPANGQTLSTLQVPTNLGLPMKLRTDLAGATIYFISNNIYKIRSNETSFPSSAFIMANGRNFYGLRINNNSVIYVSDAVDFQSTGKVYRYRDDGGLMDSFDVGIAPSDFFFL